MKSGVPASFRGEREERHRRGHRRHPPQRLPERRVLLEEEPDHRQEQQEVARIGDAHAPGVVAHREDAAQAIFVIISLIEAVAAVLGDVVHRDPDRISFGEKGDVGPVVERTAGPLVEGQRRRRLVVQFIGRRRLSFAQVDAAARAEKERNQRPRQDDDEADVKAQGPQPFGRSRLHQVNQPGYGCDGPKDNEQRTVVEPLESHGRPVQPFDDGGGHHHRDEDRRRAKGQILASSFHAIERD